MIERATPPIAGHGRLREHLVDRSRQLFGPRDPQREDADLAAVGAGPVRPVEVLDDSLDLRQEIGVNGHDQRVRIGIGGDIDRALPSLVGVAPVVLAGQGSGEVLGVGGAKLEDAQGRHFLGLGLVEAADQGRDDLVLVPKRRHQQRVGPLDRLEEGRRPAPASDLGQLAAGEVPQELDDVRRGRVLQGHEPNVRRRADRFLKLVEDRGDLHHGLVVGDDQQGRALAVDLDAHRLGAGHVGGLLVVEAQGSLGKRLRIGPTHLEDPKRPADRHRPEVAEHLLGLGERDLVTGDDERAADGLGLDDDVDGLPPVGGRRAHHPLPRYLVERAGDLHQVAALDVVGAQLGPGRQLDAIELLDEGLELGPPLGGGVDDERVGGPHRGDVHLLGLLEVRERAPAAVPRHGRLGVEVLKRLGDVLGAGPLEPEEHRLQLGLGVARVVDAVHELLDLIEDLRVGGDHQGVGGPVGAQFHRPLAPLIGGPGGVAVAEHVGDLHGVGGADLDQSQRGQLGGLEGVEPADVALDHLVLRGLRHHVEAVGSLDDLDGRLGDRPRRIDRRRRAQQFAQGTNYIGDLGVGELDQPSGPRRRQELAGLAHGLLVDLHGVASPADEQVAGQGVELDARGRAVVGVGSLAHPVVEKVGLRDQPLGVLAAQRHHTEGEVAGVGPVERGDEGLEHRELLGPGGDHEQVQGIDGLDRRGDELGPVVRLEQLAGEGAERGHEPAGHGVGQLDLPGLAVDDGVVLDHAQRLGEAIEGRGRTDEGQHPRLAVVLALERPLRIVGLHLLVVELAGLANRHLGLDRGEPKLADVTVGPGRPIEDRQERLDRVDVLDEAGDDERSAVGPGEHLGGDHLASVEERAQRRGDRVGLAVLEGEDGDGPRRLLRLERAAVDLPEQRLRFGDGRLGADHRHLRDVVEGQDGRSLGLGQLGIELVELLDDVGRGQPHQPEGAHRPPTRHRRHVEQCDRLPQLVEPVAGALGDDRVRPLVGGHAQPRQRFLLDLDLLALLVDHVLLDAPGEERLERLHEVGCLGVLDGEDLDEAVGVGPVELVDDPKQPADLGRGLGDDQRVLLVHRGDRAVLGHHSGELLREGLGQRHVERPDDGDDLVGHHVGGQLADVGRDVLALHLRELLQVEHVLAGPEHDALGLQDDVQHPKRLGQVVLLGREVVERAVGDIGLLDDRQPRDAREEVDHLIEGRALEVEADPARSRRCGFPGHG